MKFQSFYWLSHHGIIGQKNMLYKYGKRMRDSLKGLFLFYFSFLCFGDVFNKTIIPLPLVGFEMIIDNSPLRSLSTISYLALARGIIANYTCNFTRVLA